MEHIAIMNKSWGLLPKIVSGHKTIESRWLMNRAAPWNKVHEGETVYFKDTTGLVTTRATVSHVLQFDNLTPDRVHELLDFYGEDDGIMPAELARYEALFSRKRYCVLIFLENIQPVEPFAIDKRGFGAMASWISVLSVSRLKK